MTKFLFESATCSRCGGSGKFSFNMIHGDMCYGCRGAGEVLTKRGEAAQDYFDAALKQRADEFVVGDLINVGFSKVRFATVLSVRDDELNPGRIIIETSRGDVCTWPHREYRKGFSAEAKQAIIDAALAYQASLTKAGKPRKSKIVDK